MYVIARRFTFSASHQLTTLPDDHKCRRLHGHTYTVEVQLASKVLDEHGFVTDFAELAPVGQWLRDNLDHQHLNDVIDTAPSSENLAKLVFDRCALLLAPAVGRLVAAVWVSETEHSWAEYRPASEGGGLR